LGRNNAKEESLVGDSTADATATRDSSMTIPNAPNYLSQTIVPLVSLFRTFFVPKPLFTVSTKQGKSDKFMQLLRNTYASLMKYDSKTTR
jgi:hypothetical protein